MQAVILTGGLGTRLRPLTRSVPKGLAPVAGRPFLEYLLLYLKRFGVERVLLCTGWLGKKIEARFRDGKEVGLKIEYSREKKPLGTGGALKAALGLLEPEFYLLNGDTLLPGNWSRLREVGLNTGSDLVLSAVSAKSRSAPGNLRLGPDGLVEAYSKSAASGGFGHIDAGVSYLRRRVSEFFPAEEVFSLETDVYPALISRGRLRAVVMAETFYDIGTPEGLQSFSDYAEKKSSG